jgi:hypothetical protein
VGYKKYHSELYAYLQKAGVLEGGSNEAIKQAKNEYWKLYKRNWIKEKRKEAKAFTILYSKQEQATIERYSKEHGMSPTKMIKQASLAYLKQGYVIPNRETVGKIRELLSLNYNSLQQLQDEDKISHVRALGLLEQMASLEAKIMDFLQTPHQ